MPKWKELNPKKTLMYIIIMFCFSCAIFINLSIKLPKDIDNNTKNKIVAANFFGLIGFCILLLHHYINTLWKEGFIIIIVMILFSLFSTYMSFSLFNQNLY